MKQNHIKFFRKLFLSKTPKSFTSRKFRHIEPLLLPLDTKVTFGHTRKKTNWQIEQVKGPNTDYFHHLIPPANNRVNTREEPKLQTAFLCKPQDPRSSLEHLIIGLHKNSVASFMAIPKAGNSLKLCRDLCGINELPDLNQLNNPLLVNQFSYQFVSKAGADPRARASLVVRCDNKQDVSRIEAFLGGIHRFVPFNQELMNLTTHIIEQSKECIPFTAKVDELVSKKNKFTLPRRIIFANYSPKIQEEIKRIDQEIKALQEQSRWQVPFDFPQKERLNLFAGYPNGIPDLQQQKNILTYYLSSINHFPENIPEIHLAILSGDYKSLMNILVRNPMAIYDRDFDGNLPIELAYHTMQIEIGAEIYDTWAKLPKSQQWATEVFVETANNLSQLEFEYSYVLDEELQAKRVRDYFHEQLPLLDEPLPVYKAIAHGDQVKLKSLCAQELMPWRTLHQLCLEGRVQEAKQLFAQLLPEKHAVFAAILQSNWQDIIDAINDYIPDISGLDSAILYGKQEVTEHLRREPILKDWHELQDAIDKSEGVPELERKIDKLIKTINSLENPTSTDRNALEDANEQLWNLHEEKSQQLAAYEEVRKKVSDSQWQLKRELKNFSIKYLEFFKEKIRSATKDQTSTEGLIICAEIMKKELEFFNNVLVAIRGKDPEKLMKIFPGHGSKNHLSFLGYGFMRSAHNAEATYKYIFDGGIMPKHFELYFALFRNDHDAAFLYLNDYLSKKEKVVNALDSIDSAKQFFSRNIPKRPESHKQIIRGEMPPIKEYVAEKLAYEKYKTDLQNIFREQCKALKEFLNSFEPEQLALTFIKIIRDDVRTEESLSNLITYYINQIVTDPKEMNALENEFTRHYEKYTNNASDKAILLDAWNNIRAIKSTSINKIKERTEKYQNVSLCQDKSIFQIYTMVLIHQQGSIVYQNILEKKREQQFHPFLRARIEQTMKGKTAAERAKFTALKSASGVWAGYDRFLDCVIKSSLLSYERQDPWGYTLLLLAVVNNHLDIVRSFFENDLVSSWVMPLGRRELQFYTLLAHARHRMMTSDILHYFTDPNTTFIFHEGLERNLAVLLMYHHEQTQCVDTHGQSLLDFIASGHPYDPIYLDELLKHYYKHNIFVQEGPYDPTMPLAVQRAFERHNQRLINKLKEIETKAKITNIGGLFHEVGIKTILKTINHDGKVERFFSVLKKTDQLTQKEKETLPSIFAACFECSDEPKSDKRSIDYFNNNVLTNKNYIYELFYHENTNVIVGFYCFQVKLVKHAEFGHSLLVHLSIAACAPTFADKGLLGTFYKVILALKRCCDDLDLSLKCYGRFGRPGIAYSSIPTKATTSVKYYNKKEYNSFVAGVFGNSIKENGTSIWPFRSKAKAEHTNNLRLEDFNFLLDVRLQGSEDASLPLVIEVDDPLIMEWNRKLSESTGITEQQIEALYRRLKPLIFNKQSLHDKSFEHNIGIKSP